MILDTSFLIDILKGDNIEANKIATELDKSFEPKFISSISVMELWRGVLRSFHSAEEKKSVSNLLRSVNILSFGYEEAKLAGEIESHLIRTGQMIDLEDIMIAATARFKNEKIITRNVKHFSKISNLMIMSY